MMLLFVVIRLMVLLIIVVVGLVDGVIEVIMFYGVFLISVRLLLLVSICGDKYLMFGVLCVCVMFLVNLLLMCFMLVLLMVSFVNFWVCFLFVL